MLELEVEYAHPISPAAVLAYFSMDEVVFRDASIARCARAAFLMWKDPVEIDTIVFIPITTRRARADRHRFLQA